MKKVVAVTLLAASAAFTAGAQSAEAPAAGGQQQSSDVQLPQAEYNAYTNAMSQTDPKAKAAALEAYLQQYPQSPIKSSALEVLLGAYSTYDVPKTLETGDKLLQLVPNNLRALAIETSLNKSQGDQAADPAAKQAAYDKAASYAQRALALNDPPKSMTADDFKKLKDQVTPYLYSAIGADALAKKDYPGAISAFESELKSVPPETTKQPAPFLLDTFFLAQSYYNSTPPDLLKCTFYATRVATFAPDQFKPQFQPLASYCYKKYHGGDDGYDVVKTAASANVFYPSDLSVKPAPTPEDLVNQLFTSTPDLSTLALSDREFVIQNGKPEDADKVFAPVKGKEVSTSGVVVSVTDTDVQLSVSDDAKQGKVADFDFKLKEPLKKVPAVGDTIEMVGTFDSYTQKPLLITMINASPLEKATPAKKTTTTHHTHR